MSALMELRDREMVGFSIYKVRVDHLVFTFEVPEDEDFMLIKQYFVEEIDPDDEDESLTPIHTFDLSFSSAPEFIKAIQYIVKAKEKTNPPS